MATNWVNVESTDVAMAEEALPQVEMPEVKLFGKWSLDEVQVSDISLVVSHLTFLCFVGILCYFDLR